MLVPAVGGRHRRPAAIIHRYSAPTMTDFIELLRMPLPAEVSLARDAHLVGPVRTMFPALSYLFVDDISILDVVISSPDCILIYSRWSSEIPPEFRFIRRSLAALRRSLITLAISRGKSRSSRFRYRHGVTISGAVAGIVGHVSSREFPF
jgi:hypothetical protein